MKNILFFASALGALVFSPVAHAVGPRSVLSNGTPVIWSSMPVDVHLESDLDVRGKDALPLIQDALSEWSSISEADVSFQIGNLGASVDVSNECSFLYDPAACPTGPTDDGLNPLIIDEDGEIMGDFFGAGNKFTTLGFASIISFDTVTGHAVRGEAVFNASCLEGFEVAGCPASISFSDDDFTSFIVHEVGHFLGLDHSQVNLTESTDADDTNDRFITTMFPTFILDNGADFKTPEKDDRVGLAQLYPASDFESSTWVLQGTALDTDKDQVQCVNLVARNVSDPRVDAVSALSGDFAPARTQDGHFEIPGLTPGATYQLDFERIGTGFLGASGYTPCRGSSGEASPPSVVGFTSSQTYTAFGGTTLTVRCTEGDDCVTLSSGGGSGGGSGGCQLIR